MKLLEEVTTVLLDMDGTLTDLSKRWWEPFFRALYQLKPDRDPKLVEAELERVIGSIIQEAGGNSRFVNIKIFWRITSVMQLNLIERFKILQILRNDSNAFKELVLLENAESTVNSLSDRGYKLALVTSASSETVHLAMSKYPFFDKFQTIITRDMITRTKPNPEAILLACDQLGVKPNHAVMVGDFPLDVKAGKLAGTKTIAVLGPNSRYTRKMIEDEAPDLMLEDIGDLLQYFPKILSHYH